MAHTVISQQTRACCFRYVNLLELEANESPKDDDADGAEEDPLVGALSGEDDGPVTPTPRKRKSSAASASGGRSSTAKKSRQTSSTKKKKSATKKKPKKRRKRSTLSDDDDGSDDSDFDPTHH
jgi:hypothetical protein